MRFKKMRIGIDVDDVLYECTSYAIRLANEKNGTSLSINDVTEWGRTGRPTDVVLEYYDKPEFYATQPIIEGAKEFIWKLSEIAEVFFVTAVYPEALTVRAMRLMQDFPWVSTENLILSKRKDMVQLDMMLDDGAHNILSSSSTYPVLMRRPWNQNITGCLSVNNYKEFMTIVKTIQNQSISSEMNTSGKNSIIVLVGPSGSGKTAIMDKMVEKGLAKKVRSYTTREKRDSETWNADYYFISNDLFLEMEKDGVFLESTRYAGYGYGTTKQEIENALKDGNCVLAMDICGAMAIKSEFGDRAKLVYVDRPQKDLLASLIDRNITTEEKVNRILSLNDEKKNEALCDVTFKNDIPLETKAMSVKIMRLAYGNDVGKEI